MGRTSLLVKTTSGAATSVAAPVHRLAQALDA